ncbi:MAG: exodeoxyribonuclease VII large subunit [Candidatus Margulisiibacteriota bacterium]|jgi:exodeoxyribonuclease VII large subunit
MQKFLSISQINDYVKNLLESDIILNDIWVTGELTNVKFYPKGRQFFLTLTDGLSQINAVMYDYAIQQLKFELQDGLKVMGRAKLKVFNKKGSYLLQINYLGLQGEGELANKLDQLKEQLFKEGLFDGIHKKPIPKYPQKIALITSYDSAAMWDFITIAKHQLPHLKICVIPAIMQGEQSINSLNEAISILEKNKTIEVALILRGGGASEDLSNFNSEALVRKIFKMKTPVISAIGHEVNYTLTDFVSDLRVPTPTAAAHFFTNNFQELKLEIKTKSNQIAKDINEQIKISQDLITDNIIRINRSLDFNLKIIKEKSESLAERLNAANPLHKIKQGFSVTRDATSKKVIKSIKDLQKDQLITTELIDGKFCSKVIL